MMVVVCILLATLMLAGWGWAFRRLLALPRSNWPATLAIGMAAVVFLGGILNLLRLAYPWAIAVVAAGGVLLSVLGLRDQPPRKPSIFLSVIIAAIVIFTIATQLPPGVYNFHDDFQKYFAYTVRMLQTGTVYGSPMSAIGQQTLGAQAFLDGFVAAFFPIAYLNGVDAVFGLLLCLMLATQFTESRVMTLVCVLSVVVINPQYVNISALYLGSALIMAIALYSVEGIEPATIGLLYAALISMKPTFIIFVGIHFWMVAHVSGWRWTWRTAGASAIFLSPWLLLHSPHYLAGLRHPQPPPTPVPGPIEPDPVHLFSNVPLDFGDAALHYTLLMIAIALCGALCYRGPKFYACCAAGLVTYLTFAYGLSPLHAGFPHSVRYFCPIAIGLAPPAFGWAGSFKRSWILAAIPLILFLPSTKTRYRWAIESHSVASFDWLSRTAEYIDYSHFVMSEKGREQVKTIQDLIPPGEPILAWMNAPFYFDYRRNPIIDIDLAGMGLPWAHLPPAKYFILDYEGYPTFYEGNYIEDAKDVGAGERRNARYALDYLHRINALIAAGQILYDDGKIKVAKIVN